MLVISSGARFDEGTFHKCLYVKENLESALHVDLRRCIFVDPYSLIETLTLMTVASRVGWKVKMSLPQAKGRDTYLARMHFFALAPDGVSYDRQPPIVEERARSLVPLMKLDIEAGEHGIDQLCNWVFPQLPTQLAGSFVEALAEIGSNVIHHSEADVGFVVGQRYEKNYQGRIAPRLSLVVGDAGIGVKASLAEAKPEVAQLSDLEAIRLAKSPYVTSKPERHSGVGLSTVQEYADMFGGSLRIRSGEGTVLRRTKIDRNLELPGLNGTIVSVELCSPGRRRKTR